MKIKYLFKHTVSVLVILIVFSCKENSNKTNVVSETSTVTPSNNNSSADDYTSKMTKADKKKYYDASGNTVFEIKYKPDGFKLRTASSQLLWKIKFYDNKLKISDNEENLNPFEIKLTEANKAKLVKNETTLAKTSYNLEKKEQVLSSENESPEFFNQNYSPSLLVSKITDIPNNQKQIIIKELILKGY